MDTGDGRGQAGSPGAKTRSLPLAPSGRESTCSGHGGRKLPSPTLEHLKGCRVHGQVAHPPPHRRCCAPAHLNAQFISLTYILHSCSHKGRAGRGLVPEDGGWAMEGNGCGERTEGGKEGWRRGGRQGERRASLTSSWGCRNS